MEKILCIATFEKGAAFMRQAARMGCHVSLLTTDKLSSRDWPWDSIAEFHTMPEDLTYKQIQNTVAYLCRTRNYQRIVALDEFDIEVAARLREHLCIPGMPTSVAYNYRDKLAMRTTARNKGFLVPEFTRVVNYEELSHFMQTVPTPWLLKPRSSASAIGIRKAPNSDSVWQSLNELGDEQSDFILERFVPGEIYHVDSIVLDGKVIFQVAHKYGKPPMQVMHDGGVFTTRTLDRNGEEWRALTELNQALVPALGMTRGVTHAEYIRSHADGRFYFLEVAARVGGAFIAEVVEFATGVDLWAEWARIEITELRGETYHLPPTFEQYAGSVLCLAKQETPDTGVFTDPEVVYRMAKHHHAGLIVKSSDAERVQTLLDQYSLRFLDLYCAVISAPERPVA
jgi:biotin carboxylase